jgi:uncharacterized protein YjbJ (UPF0337 family)
MFMVGARYTPSMYCRPKGLNALASSVFGWSRASFHRARPHDGPCRRVPESFILCGRKPVRMLRARGHCRHPEDDMVDRNRIKGSGRKVGGDVKRAAGRALGDRKLEGEGRADRAAGKTRNAVGSLKDAARDAIRPRGTTRSGTTRSRTRGDSLGTR